MDLTAPEANITEANVPDPNILGLLVVQGTAWDKRLNRYQILLSQSGSEPNVLHTGYETVQDDVLGTIYTFDYDDGDANVILRVWDDVNNFTEFTYQNSVTIANPPPHKC